MTREEVAAYFHRRVAFDCANTQGPRPTGVVSGITPDAIMLTSDDGIQRVYPFGSISNVDIV